MVDLDEEEETSYEGSKACGEKLGFFFMFWRWENDFNSVPSDIPTQTK